MTIVEIEVPTGLPRADQVPPLSVLLNRPPIVPAYNVEVVCGSIAIELTDRLVRPWLRSAQVPPPFSLLKIPVPVAT